MQQWRPCPTGADTLARGLIVGHADPNWFLLDDDDDSFGYIAAVCPCTHEMLCSLSNAGNP
jgi:hypothetical protein